MIFELEHGGKFSGENKDNRSLNYHLILVAPWKFDVLKTNIFACKASLLGQYLFYEHQISTDQLSGDSSSTETLYCLNRDLKFIV